MGVLLFLVAIVIFLPLQLFNLVLVLWVYRNKRGFLKNIDIYFKQSAIDIDRYGNRTLRTLLNKTLIKKDGYLFGDERETISSVLGKNELTKKLTKFGKILVLVLDKLDENHCKKSIKWF